MERSLHKFIDHTLLSPDARKEDIDKLLEEAKQYDVYSVCVNSYWVKYCAEQLNDTNIKVCTVVGFPLGATLTEVKVTEAKEAVQKGAKEIDMVLNIGELKAGNDREVEADIREVVDTVKDQATVKVIMETALLTEEEIVRGCQIVLRSGAHFVKTSTGFSTRGATIKDIQLMKNTVGNRIGIKASGGIRDRRFAKQLIEAGATRIGASSTGAILSRG